MTQVPDIPARQIVYWTLGVLFVGSMFWALWRFHDVIIVLLAAIIIGTAIKPLIRWLGKHGVAKPLAIGLVLAVLVIFAFLLIWFALPMFANQGGAIAEALGEGYELLLSRLQRFPNILVHRLLVVMPDDLSQWASTGRETVDANGDNPSAGMLSQGQRLLRSILPFIAVVLMTIYWTMEGDRLRHAALLLVPIRKRGEIRELLDEIESKVGSYLVGQGLLSLTIGVLAFVAYMVIGLPHALFLAAFAGLMEAVPVVGPFIGAIPAVIIALTISPATVLWVVIATLVMQQLENNLLVPRVMKRTVGVSPLVTLLALLAFGSLFGIMGALIALPLAAIVQLLLERFVLADDDLLQSEDRRDRLSLLRYEANQLVTDIRHYIRDKETVPSANTDALEDEVEAIAADLESFLAMREGAVQ